MPPKKASPVAVTEDASSMSLPEEKPKNEAKPAGEKSQGTEKKMKTTVVKRPMNHPATIEMITEALRQLDTKKGTSVQAIRTYILGKYPTVDPVRLKPLMKSALNKGIEKGTLVRPANSSASGAQGRFRLAVKKVIKKNKEAKLQSEENNDPNIAKAPKSLKAGSKKPKTKDSDSKEKPKAVQKKKEKNEEESRQPSGEKESSKVTSVKKPKAKKDPSGQEAPAPKELKEPKKAAKPKAPVKKAGGEEGVVAEGQAGAKTTGKRGKKVTE
nr:PREDICTED: protein B4 isoform X1 [Lepisosteus oculatus]